jgi:hypothetical protein
LEITANFVSRRQQNPLTSLSLTSLQLYFSGTNRLFTYTRPYEALFRDPWWIFTTVNLLYNIKSRYEFGYVELIRVSPRFGVMLAAMLLSLAFIIVDILAVTHVIPTTGLPNGINPFWKLAFVFKCLSDTMVLDDFKTALDRLKTYKMERMGSVLSDGVRGDFVDVELARKRRAEEQQHMPSGAVDSVHVKDWSKSGDAESALRMGQGRGESSGSSAPGKVD